MLRPLILAILGAALLCVLFGVPQLPPFAHNDGGMQGHAPKQPQMDAPPAISSLTASQLQTDSVHSQKADAIAITNGAPLSRTLYQPAAFLRDRIQTSTILRI